MNTDINGRVAPEYGHGGVYFVSDVHLGSLQDKGGARESLFVDFLRGLPPGTTDLYLLGDVFDFWVEYRDVVPRGFVRVLGELAVLSDRGVKLHFMRGNHDCWLTDYLSSELGMEIIGGSSAVRTIEGRNVCIGHGDGLGPVNFSSRLIFRLFRSRFCIALMKAVHPRLVFGLARRWSSHSRSRHCNYSFAGENEPLCVFAESLAGLENIDCFVFGHLHTPVNMTLQSGSRLFILGDWGSGVNYLNFSGMYISGRGLPNIEM